MQETRPVIVGAGPAGVGAALFLAKAGVPSLLLDKASFPRDKICGDALSGKVMQELRRLGEDLPSRLGGNPATVGSWGVRFVAPNGRDVRVPFRLHYDASQELAPGFIMPRKQFDHELLQLALASPFIEVRQNWELKKITPLPAGIQLTNASGQQLIANLLLAADGAQSQVVRQLQGHRLQAQHYCAGLRQYYQGVQGLEQDNFIELHFLKAALPGYLWVFPLADGAANVGIGIRSDVVARKKINLKSLLADQLQNHPELAARFAKATPKENPQGFGLPLGSYRRPISGNNYLLLGDAASLIDPFTGEGIGNAITSGRLAAAQVLQWQATGNATAKALQTYDAAVYSQLWAELRLGRIMQQLATLPWLFNLVVNKAQRSATLRQTLSGMFENLNLRAQLKRPGFYLRLLMD